MESSLVATFRSLRADSGVLVPFSAARDMEYNRSAVKIVITRIAKMMVKIKMIVLIKFFFILIT